MGKLEDLTYLILQWGGSTIPISQHHLQSVTPVTVWAIGRMQKRMASSPHGLPGLIAGTAGIIES